MSAGHGTLVVVDPLRGTGGELVEGLIRIVETAQCAPLNEGGVQPRKALGVPVAYGNGVGHLVFRVQSDLVYGFQLIEALDQRVDGLSPGELAQCCSRIDPDLDVFVLEHLDGPWRSSLGTLAEPGDGRQEQGSVFGLASLLRGLRDQGHVSG